MIINSVVNKQNDLIIFHINGKPRSNKLHRCKCCNKLFRSKIGAVGRPRQFCSDLCTTNFFNNRFNHVDNIFISEKDLTKEELASFETAICPICDESFPKTHHRRIYCSFECALEAKNKTSTINNEKLKFQCRGMYLGSIPPKKLTGVNNYKALAARYKDDTDQSKNQYYNEEDIYGKVYDSFEDADADADAEYNDLDSSEDFNYDDWYGDYED
jgi:hypothetical protein